MRIAELFRKKRAVWSFEVFPPKQQYGERQRDAGGA